MALSSSGANSSLNKKSATEDSNGVQVKQESPDEAEIKELAAKMVEANKTKLAATAASRNCHANNHVIPPGQTNIQNFMTKQSCSSNKDGSKKPAETVEREVAIDEDSARGRFGWETFGKCYVPYIYRRGVKYVAVRMVEMKLLNKFLAHVHPDLYSCTCIRSYFITEAEARLLNEINIRHSEGQFGKESFTSKDSVVLLQDAIEFYNFLEVTHSKLLLHKNDPKDKCGFIRINGEAVVPFTVRDGEKYVPLFYFEGETDNLKLKAKQLEGWDLSYLKFCCKVQGIRNELFASDTCSVISLNDIKSYFPASTQFQDYWPVKVINPLLLDNVSSGTQQGAWTKQPGGTPTPVVKSTLPSSLPSHHQASKPLLTSDTQMKMLVPNSHLPNPSLHQPQIPTPTTTVHSAARMNACPAPTSSASAINGWSGLVGGQPTYQSTNQSMRLGSTAIPGLNPASTAANRQYQNVRARPGQPYYAQVPTVSATLPPSQSTLSSSVASHPPPLIRGTAATATMGSATTYASSATLPTMSHSSVHGVMDSRQQMSASLAASNLMHTSTTASSVSASRAMARDPLASSAKYPPPLVPVVNPHNPQVSQAIAPVASSVPPPPPPPPQTNTRYGYSTSAEVIDLSSPPRSPHRSQQQVAQMQSQHHSTQRLQPQAHQLQHPSQAHQIQHQHQTRQQQASQHQQQATQHQQQATQHQQQATQHQQQATQHQQQATQHQQQASQHQQQQRQPQPPPPQQQQQQQQQQQTTVQHQQQQHQTTAQHQQQHQEQMLQQRQREMHNRALPQMQSNQSQGSVRGAPTSVHAGGGSNGDLSRHDPSTYKLIQIQDTYVTGQHMPYKVSKAYVEGQLVPCINAKPYIYSELLMTLPDLTSHFFSAVSWHTLRQVLQDVLGVSLFRGNRLHMQVLRTSGKCQSTSDILPLVQVRDVMQYMPQLKYMFGRINNDKSLSKRQRTS